MSVETAKPPTTMSEKIVETLGDVIVASLEATAQISLGQGLLRVADRFLWVVEKSAQWSLPVHEVNAEENGKAFGKIELVRPLPWIFFLPSLVMLRACRLGINVGAVILGYPTLQATGMVKFIQKGRRRLRTIKSNGVKNMRHRKGSRNKEDELTEAKKSLIKSMLSTLSALSCLETSRRTPSPPPTRVCVQNSEPDATPTPEEKSTTESTSPQVDPKRKYSEVVDLDDSSEVQSAEESTEEKLERLAAADSDIDDQDFDPAEEELMASDSTSADEEDDDDYLSETEVNDLHIDSALNCIPKPVTAVGDVIPEESESDAEGFPESVPESERESAANANNISTPNKTAGEQPPETLQLAKESEDNEPLEDGQLTPRAPVTPVTPGMDGENNVEFYSPIDSPADSIRDYTSPVPNDDNDLILAEEQLNNTPPKIAKEPETQVDNEPLESNEKSKISGNSTDGQTATTNGTNDEKRSNYHTTGKSHHNGNHTDLKQQGKEKKGDNVE